ncbi:MAG: hypothetical protein ACE5NC_00070 [Anaerolineae bacterium]
MHQSGGLAIQGNRVELRDSGAGIIAGSEVVGDEIRAGLVLAGEVKGNVRPILDQRSAMTLGAALGASLAVLYLLRGVLGRRG